MTPHDPLKLLKKKKTLNHGFPLQLYYNFNIVITILSSAHVIIITSLRRLHKFKQWGI